MCLTKICIQIFSQVPISIQILCVSSFSFYTFWLFTIATAGAASYRMVSQFQPTPLTQPASRVFCHLFLPLIISQFNLSTHVLFTCEGHPGGPSHVWYVQVRYASGEEMVMALWWHCDDLILEFSSKFHQLRIEYCKSKTISILKCNLFIKCL